MPSSNPDLAHYFFHKLPFNHTNINRERERERENVNMFLYAFRKKINQKFDHFASNREFQNIKSLMPKFDHTFIHLYNLSKT